MWNRLKTAWVSIWQEIRVYQLVRQHPRTPKLAKVLIGLAIGYALSPIDLIPDFIPVIGHLDDALIVPALIFIARRLIPDDVIAECRGEAKGPHFHPRSEADPPLPNSRGNRFR